MIKILENQIDTRLSKNDMSGIYLRDCNWAVKTAGPSPDNNNRTELFLLGCDKAMSGNPCNGCFNATTWDSKSANWTHDPIKMAEHINNNAPNKYITIGGGEPTDQINNLIILCRELKKHGFHIMMYTWRDLQATLSNPLRSYEVTKLINNFKTLLNYVDIIVDGEYKQEERLWNGDKGDGLFSSVGSGNQIIWDIKNKRGFAMRDIVEINLTSNNNLSYKINANSAHREIKLKY